MYYDRRRGNPGREAGEELTALAAAANKEFSEVRIILKDLQYSDNVVTFTTSAVNHEFMRIMNKLEEDVNSKRLSCKFSMNGPRISITFNRLKIPGYNASVAAYKFMDALRQKTL